MEVHAHTHTARKKWTHYFWEFLMLFFAVFCGFLAENQREHFVEHQREKKYMQSLLADLKGDTTEIKSVIDFNITKFRGLDTLISALNSMQNKDELYRLNRYYAVNIYTMIFNDRTMRQLLNSGNMRLIRRQAISDSIMNYYGQSKDDIMGQEEVYGEMSKRLLFLAEDIFDQTLSSLKIDDKQNFYRVSNSGTRELLTKDKRIIKKYAQTVSTCQGMLAIYLELLFDMKDKSERLLSLLEKEYRLK